MIARSNLDLLSALAQAGATQAAPPSVNAAMNQRFDAALLQAAKVVKDGSGQSVEIEKVLTPKVEQALESLLNELVQQPETQIRQWAKQPELLRPAVESLARTYALDPKETADLAAAVPLATKGLSQALDSFKVEVEKTVKLSVPGTYSGPQGRESGTTVEPAENLNAPIENTLPIAPEKERSTEIPATLAPAMVWAPTLVSTRTDSGSNSDSQVSLASRSVEAAVATSTTNVRVNTLQANPSANAPVAVPSPPQAIAPVQVEVAAAPVFVSVQTQAPAKAVAPGTDSIAKETSKEPAPQVLPAKPSLVVSEIIPSEIQSPASRSTATSVPAPIRNTLNVATNDAPVKSEDEQLLDFKVATTSSAPVAVKEGSVFSLNSDGRTQGIQQLQPAIVEQASPVVPAAATALAPQTNAPAPKVELPVSAEPLVTVTTTQPLAIPLPVTEQVAISESLSTPSKPVQSSNSSEPAFEASALEHSAGFQTLVRSNREDAPQSALNFGQGELRQLLNQVAKELGVREAAFAQVSEALAATGKETSHLLIKLKPASLGEVQIDLLMEGGKLTARLVASTAEVRDAFVRDLPAFKASLETQGIKIDQVSVAVRAETNFNSQSQSQNQAPYQNWTAEQTNGAATAFSTPLTQGAWADSVLNDQLFSALA